MRRVTVELVINSVVEHELEKLLPIVQGFTREGTEERPYKDYDKDQLLQMALEVGNSVYIMEQLHFIKMLLKKEA